MIANRRAKVDDRNREKLPDSPDSDAREVLAYLRKYSSREIPRWVLQADVCDALTLNNWLWWEDKRTELHWLKAGVDRGLFLTQIGAQVGVKKQGVLDRIDRLESLLRYDRPDEKLTRSARRAQREAQQRRPAEELWLGTHRDTVMDVIADLVDHADRYALKDDEREWVDELAIEGEEDDLRPATMTILGLACSELRTAPAVLALDSSRPYGVHAALARADGLRSRFAVLA